MKVSPILRPHVVIIGGGFGGLEAARRLARADVTITRCAQAVPVSAGSRGEAGTIRASLVLISCHPAWLQIFVWAQP